MKNFLIFISLISLTFGFFSGWAGYTAVLTVGFLAFVILIFIANLDQISEFKASGSGIEAKTRDVLKKTENTLTELQSLAKIFSEIILSTVKRAGRWDGYNDEEQEKIKISILKILKQLGIPESEHESVLSDWHKFTEFDYVYWILGGHTIPTGFEDQAIVKEWEKLRDFENISNAEKLREFLSKWNLLTSERNGYIEDYEFYIKNRKHNRIDVWRKRESWSVLKKP